MSSSHQEQNGTVFIEQTENVRQTVLTDKDDVQVNRSDLKRFGYIGTDKLGFFSVFCLIVNRMIGTGIFEQPSTVLAGCGSPAAALLLWTLGAIIATSGLLVHIEWGLSVPRYPKDDGSGQLVCVPRSGGEKNYFEFLFRKQKLLPVCIYGFIFVFLGNTAGNAIIFADYFLRMVGVDKPNEHEWMEKGVGVAVITFACFMHSIWRKGGIFMLNILTVIKILILWTIIILGWVARGGHFKSLQGEKTPGWTDLALPNSFWGRYTGFYGWAIAILGVLYAYGGFQNANYVLSEIEKPKVVLPRASLLAVGLTSVTYILTNISYHIVIPARDMFPNSEGTVQKPGLLFFQQLFVNSSGVQKGVSALIALSSFGNLMVVTFVASRVKQEIAKEGILPFYKFWEKEWDSGWRIILNWIKRTSPADRLDDNRRSDKTPIPALFLHWITSIILILAPPGPIVYQLFTRLYSYMLQALFGMILSGGLLFLRYIKPLMNSDSKWEQVANQGFRMPNWIRAIYPTIFLAATAFLAIAPFVQHGNSGESKISQSSALKWFVFQTVCLSLFGGGVVYWLIIDKFIPWGPKYYLSRYRTVFIDRNGELEYEGVKAAWLPTGSQAPVDEEPEDPLLPSGRFRDKI